MCLYVYLGMQKAAHTQSTNSLLVTLTFQQTVLFLVQQPVWHPQNE